MNLKYYQETDRVHLKKENRAKREKSLEPRNASDWARQLRLRAELRKSLNEKLKELR